MYARNDNACNIIQTSQGTNTIFIVPLHRGLVVIQTGQCHIDIGIRRRRRRSTTTAITIIIIAVLVVVDCHVGHRGRGCI